MSVHFHYRSAQPPSSPLGWPSLQRMTCSTCLSVTHRHSTRAEKGSTAPLPRSAQGSELTTACMCGHVTTAMTSPRTTFLRSVGGSPVPTLAERALPTLLLAALQHRGWITGFPSPDSSSGVLRGNTSANPEILTVRGLAKIQGSLVIIVPYVQLYISSRLEQVGKPLPRPSLGWGSPAGTCLLGEKNTEHSYLITCPRARKARSTR